MHFDINIHCSNALPLTCKNVIHATINLSSFILKVFTPYFYLSQQKSKKEYYYNFVFFSPQKVLFHCDSPPLSIILCPKGGKLLYYYLYFMTNDKMYPLINNMIIIAAVNRDLKKNETNLPPPRGSRLRDLIKNPCTRFCIKFYQPNLTASRNSTKVLPPLFYSLYGPDLPTKLK